MADFYDWQGDELWLRILLQPRASCNECVGTQDGRLKIRLTAPPVDGMANQQLVEFLAKQFNVAKNQVEVVKGQLARQKVVKIVRPKCLPANINRKSI